MGKYAGKQLMIAHEPKWMREHRMSHWREIKALYRSTGRRYHTFEEVVAVVTHDKPELLVRQFVNANFLGVFR